jgi:hypothetical protein
LRALLADARGAAFVEQWLVLCVGLLLAAALLSAANALFAPRVQHILDVVYADEP